MNPHVLIWLGALTGAVLAMLVLLLRVYLTAEIVSIRWPGRDRGIERVRVPEGPAYVPLPERRVWLVHVDGLAPRTFDVFESAQAHARNWHGILAELSVTADYSVQRVDVSNPG